MIHSKTMTNIIASVLVISLWQSFLWAQSPAKVNNRVDLDDVQIKGEANKNNVSFTNRSRHNLNDRIKLRKDFTKEILENLPEEFTPQKGP
ncbi:MAG: hypothetical protein IPK04_17585 [Bdellovibrionales bacterium]|nr:hypothetical protein [Bdellovibrionales bacterium]